MLSQDWEDRKMWKIIFPKLGKNGKRKKIAVPTLGKLKNSENRLSQTWENQKTLQAAFPTSRKVKNAEKHSSSADEI